MVIKWGNGENTTEGLKGDLIGISNEVSGDDIGLENVLRPNFLDEYIGQEDMKMNLKVLLEASKVRGEPVDHLLFHGPPGLGKTTIANIVAKEMGVNLRMTSGPVIEKQGDLASMLSNLKEGDVLFIDEIHRLKSNVEEVLYTAMEDFGLDLIIGKGPGAKSMRLKLPKFTLIGATTKISMLSAPLRDRFGIHFKLDFYNNDEIANILRRSAKLLQIDFEENAFDFLAKVSRRTPRIANRLLKRMRDFAQVKGIATVDIKMVKDSLEKLGIDFAGLDKNDRMILKTIINKFSGGPVGLNTISVAIAEDMQTVEEVYEPYLIQLGLLERTPRGRVATKRAYDHLGISL